MKTSPLPAPLARRLLAVGALALLTFAVPDAARSQSAGDILDEAMSRFRGQTENVRDYTVVQSVMGFRTETYFVKDTVDGQPIYVPRTSGDATVAEQVPESPLLVYARLRDRATLSGTESAGGIPCHVLTVTGLTGTELGMPGGTTRGGGWQPERLRMYVDQDEYLLRRLTMEGTVEQGGTERDARFVVDFEDYRNVEGLVHPFRMQVTTEGLGPGMSEEERADLRRSLEEMREKMDEMPAQQRAMMERVMGGKLQEMEKMLFSGSLDFTVVVEEIRVNAGPPDGS